MFKRKFSKSSRNKIIAITISTIISITLFLIRMSSGSLVWTATRDLPSGTTLGSGDLTLKRVSLGSTASKYLGGSRPANWITLVDIHSGEFLPSKSVVKDDSSSLRRIMALSVESNHMPLNLNVGQAVDVYVTPMSSQNDVMGLPEIVVEKAIVTSLDRKALNSGVSISVLDNQVSSLVEATQRGHLDLVGYPNGD